MSVFNTFFKEYCENKLNARAQRMESIADVQDQNKDLLYGISTPGATQVKFESLPLKTRRYVSISPIRRTSQQLLDFRELTGNTTPTLTPTLTTQTNRNFETENTPKLAMSRINLEGGSPTLPSKFSTLLKLQEILTPIPKKEEQTDTFTLNITKRSTLPPDATPKKNLDPKTPKPIRKISSRFKDSTPPNDNNTPRSPVITKRDISPPQTFRAAMTASRNFPIDRSPSIVLKTETVPFSGRSPSPEFATIDPSATMVNFRRKHLSSKPQRVLKIEEMYALYVESKCRLMSEFGESGKLEVSDVYKGLGGRKLHKRPHRKPVNTEELETPRKLNLSPRELTLSERIQTHRRSQSVGKVRPPSASPSKSKNIHMDQLRNQKNITKVLRPRSRMPSMITISEDQEPENVKRGRTTPVPENQYVGKHDKETITSRDDEILPSERVIQIKSLNLSRKMTMS